MVYIEMLINEIDNDIATILSLEAYRAEGPIKFGFYQDHYYIENDSKEAISFYWNHTRIFVPTDEFGNHLLSNQCIIKNSDQYYSDSDAEKYVYSVKMCDEKFALKSESYTKTECDEKFALKSNSSTSSSDLSGYRKKDDLSVNAIKHIELTRIDSKHYKCTEFYDNLHIKGNFTHSDGTIEEVDMLLQKLSLSTSGPTSEATSKATYAYIAPITKNSGSNYKFYAIWTKTDGFWTLLICYAGGTSSPLELTIDDLYFETTDELVLKSQIEELKTENENLKAMLAIYETRLKALEINTGLDNTWEKVYAEYSIKYESNYVDYVLYDDKSMTINLEGEFLDGDWLFIFLENNGKKHFVEIHDQTSMRIDLIYGTNLEFVPYADIYLTDFNLDFDNNNKRFYAIYKKP